VISTNAARRHLTEADRAVAGAKYLMELRRRAAQTEGPSADLRPGKTSEVAARLMSVSARAIEYAVRVFDSGIPELIAAIESKSVGVSSAGMMAEETVERQREILEGGKQAIREFVQSRRRKRGKRRTTPRQVKQVIQQVVKVSESGRAVLELSQEWRADLAAAMADERDFEKKLQAGILLTIKETV
jgi:hypothetical protein